MQTRKPVVAGQFYPATRQKCLAEIEKALTDRPQNQPPNAEIVAGIVPHAGWVFSGSLAAMVFAAVRERNEAVDTFVIFGAAHGYYGPEPAVYDKGSWQTPLGEISIDEELAAELVEKGPAAADTQANAYEHSIEVQVPFVQHLFSGAKLLPIVTAPTKEAVELGRAAGEIARSGDKKIVFIGSTDLTHYGPRYGFAPKGDGEGALKWAHEVNDKEFIDSALRMEPEEMLDSASRNHNACGAGAAAAAVAAAKVLGRSKGTLLAQSNSNEIMLKKMGSGGSESVGYAAIVF